MNIKKITDYMDKLNIKYTINENPTEEDIKRIKKQIEKNKKIRGLY